MPRRVVVTVAAGSLQGLEDLLVPAGFEVDRRPLLTFAPPDSWRPVDRSLERWGDYSDVVFTSPRSAGAFRDRLEEIGTVPPTGPTLWAGGPATAEALGKAAGAVNTVELRGGVGPGRGLAETLLARGIEGPVLYLCGDPHREEFADLLRQCDVEVVEVVCYQSILSETEEVRAAMDHAGIVVVGSPRVVECMAANHKDGGFPRLVTLGPTTARAAAATGWQPVTVALSPSIVDVSRAVEEAAR
jgi:uroporphyrinogen-III synthase